MSDQNWVRFVRVERPRTDSWMTVRLPGSMPFEQVEAWLALTLPDWLLVSGSMGCPDNGGAGFEYRAWF